MGKDQTFSSIRMLYAGLKLPNPHRKETFVGLFASMQGAIVDMSKKVAILNH